MKLSDFERATAIQARISAIHDVIHTLTNATLDRSLCVIEETDDVFQSANRLRVINSCKLDEDMRRALIQVAKDKLKQAEAEFESL